MKRIIYILPLLLLLIGCKHVENQWVELEDFSNLDPSKAFIPYAIEDYDLSEEKLYRCGVPGGASLLTSGVLAEMDTLPTDGGEPQSGLMRTSSTTAITLVKELLSFGHSNAIRSYCGSYLSVDHQGKPIRLSGRILLPKNGEITRIMVVSHFTIGANSEAPSQSFPLEGIFAARGIAVIESDYIGYGLTSNRIHPYLCAELTARNVVDMYLAALPFLEHVGRKPLFDDIFLFGYSQGGAATMAVQRLLERDYPKQRIRLNMAGGGPYDICATYDQIIENDRTDYPCAIPMIVQGLNEGDKLGLEYEDYFLPHVADHMDEWLNSKRYIMQDIRYLMGTDKMSEIMTEAARNKVSDGMTTLYLSMQDNSLIAGWWPIAPVYMFHSMDDNVVPFVNASHMQNHIRGCNVMFNFGHYGSHTAGFLRFLYSCIELLYNNEDIEQKL